jgi:hypothetical protein
MLGQNVINDITVYTTKESVHLDINSNDGIIVCNCYNQQGESLKR